MTPKKREIELVFDLDTGQVEGEATGYTGNACSVDVNALLNAAGKVTTRIRKDPRAEKKVRVKR